MNELIIWIPIFVLVLVKTLLLNYMFYQLNRDSFTDTTELKHVKLYVLTTGIFGWLLLATMMILLSKRECIEPRVYYLVFGGIALLFLGNAGALFYHMSLLNSENRLKRITTITASLSVITGATLLAWVISQIVKNRKNYFISK